MILQECQHCYKKQAVKNRLCDCGGDLVKLKKAGKVRFWIQYRLPGGKQRKESVGFSLEEAKDAEGKRRGQKRENRIFDMLPEAKMTFLELSEWYLSLAKIQTLAYYDILRIYLNKFNSELGHLVVSQIKPVDLENLQAKRKAQGYAESTIDQEIARPEAWSTRPLTTTWWAVTRLKSSRRSGSCSNAIPMSGTES